MPIYIARAWGGKVESIVLASSYELAQAYFFGRKDPIDNIETIAGTEEDLKNNKIGVIQIFPDEGLKQ